MSVSQVSRLRRDTGPNAASKAGFRPETREIRQPAFPIGNIRAEDGDPNNSSKFVFLFWKYPTGG
jgi:hypothetical protein